MRDYSEVFVFLHLAQTLSFQATAKHFQVERSTVSRKLASLEERLGLVLLRRTTRHVSLTSAGLDYFRHLRELEASILSAEEKLHSNHASLKGRVRLTLPVDVGEEVLPGLLSKFYKAHPEVEIELDLTDRVVNMLSENFDLAIRSGPLGQDSLKVRKLGETRFSVFASPAFLRTLDSHPKEPKALLALPCIVTVPSPGEPLPWELRNKKHPHRKMASLPRGRILYAQTLGFAKKLSLEGMGFCSLPAFLVRQEVKTGHLVQVMPEWEGESNPISLVYPSDRTLTAATRCFIDFLTESWKDAFHV